MSPTESPEDEINDKTGKNSEDVLSKDQRMLFWRSDRWKIPKEFEDEVQIAWPPDLAIEIRRDPCPSDQNQESLKGTIANRFAEYFPNLDVRITCDEPGPLRIAAWMNGPHPQGDRASRDLGMQQFSVLQGVEALGIFMGLSFIRELAQVSFSRLPKRYSEDATPDIHGPIHLVRLSVELNAPAQIVTRIDGFDDRPWPDIDFTVVIRDTINATDPIVACDLSSQRAGPLNSSSTSDTEVDTGDVILAGILGLLTIPFLAGFHFLSELLSAASTESAGNTEGGVGSALASLVQTPIPLAGRDLTTNDAYQLVPSYGRSQVSRIGITFGGCWKLALRFPTLTIYGPTLFGATTRDRSVIASYYVSSQQTFGNVSVNWSVPQARVHNPTSKETRITFSIIGATDGASLERIITVNGADEDGQLREVSMLVRINVVETGLPPVCTRKPWLPQCQPDFNN